MPFIILLGIAVIVFQFVFDILYPLAIGALVTVAIALIYIILSSSISKSKKDSQNSLDYENKTQDNLIHLSSSSENQKKSQENLADNSDIIKGELYCATLDNHCCPYCWPLDGQIFPLGAINRPYLPRHEGCRCFYSAKTKSWRDFGLDLDELPPVARPWVLCDYQYTYKRDPTKMLKTPRRIIRKCGQFSGTAEDWIRILPQKEQRQFFASDIAFSLWKAGKLKGIDLLDPQTWELRNDEELQGIAGK